MTAQTPQPTALNYQNDEVMTQVRNDPESLDVLHSVMMGLAEEAAAMAQARVSLEAQGKNTSNVSAKRVTALRAIGDTWMKRKEQLGGQSLDLEGVAFKRVFGFTMETFRKFSPVDIRPEQIEVIFAKLAKLLDEDWIKEMKKRADGYGMSGFLSDIVMGAGRVKVESRSVVDIITFIESEWGLKMRLFPVQKVILKALVFPLTTPRKRLLILIGVRRCQMLTETEYLRLLHKEGRCNISEVKAGHERREMILSVGRRSGKTTISACIAAYETYKLISKGDPQGFYGLPSSNVIQLISVATDKDQAGLLYQEVSGHFRGCSFFAPYMANNTTQGFKPR